MCLVGLVLFLVELQTGKYISNNIFTLFMPKKCTKYKTEINNTFELPFCYVHCSQPSLEQILSTAKKKNKEESTTDTHIPHF